MDVQVEVVVFSIEDVLRAKEGGAQRVELCADPGAGGTTPSYGLIKQTVALGMQAMVMIRPRGGDFIYSREELAVMADDIKAAAELGAQGVVFGILTENGSIDALAMSGLIQLAKGLDLEITCHRAFDRTADPLQALEELIHLEVDRVLTSGQQKTAIAGIPLLQKLVKRAGGKISIMPGGGVRGHNIAELLEALDVREVHTGSRTKVPSLMKFTGSAVEMGEGDSQLFHNFIDPADIRAIVQVASARQAKAITE